MKFNEEQLNRFINFALPDPEVGCLQFQTLAYADINKQGFIAKSKYPTVIGGWFNNAKSLREAARRLDGVSGYVSINPVHPSRVAQIGNRLARVGDGDLAKNEDIVKFLNLYIDIDSCRPSSKISATRSELEAALELRDRILAEWPRIAENAIWGCSGNGAFIVARVPGYPNDAEHVALAKATLLSLANRYNRGKGFPHIDTNTYYPKAMIGIPGTIKAKGENTEDRPWRSVVIDGGNY